MIFNAFVVPTPRRIRKYFEKAMDEINSDTVRGTNIENNERENLIEKIKVENSDYSVKKLGFSIKIF